MHRLHRIIQALALLWHTRGEGSSCGSAHRHEVQNASGPIATQAQLDDLAALSPLRSCARAGRVARSRAPWGADEG